MRGDVEIVVWAAFGDNGAKCSILAEDVAVALNKGNVDTCCAQLGNTDEVRAESRNVAYVFDDTHGANAGDHQR